MRALYTIIFALALAAPADAADLRVGLSASIRQLIVGPDGGAWAYVSDLERSRVARITPQGAVRWTRAPSYFAGTLGPDGQAWILDGRDLLRIDGNGGATRRRVPSLYTAMVTGPDGTAWVVGQETARMAADGTVVPLSLEVPGCADVRPSALALASDGAVWFYEHGCGFVRIPPGGAPAVVANPEHAAIKLVPDHQGGVWFSHHVAPGGGHVDAGGRVTMLKRASGRFGTWDVAVAPDGGAWYADGRCSLVKASPDGSVRRHPIALPANQVAFDPAGGVWLASATRARHTTLDASPKGCDDTPPTARIEPDPRKPVSLAALRRQGGFKVTVREPFWIEGSLFDGDEDYAFADVYETSTARHGRTVLMPLDEEELRDLARHKGTPLMLVASIRDREGNEGFVEHELRFRR